MTDFNDPASPCAFKDFNPSTGEEVSRMQWFGLTKREHFVALAMQGLLAGDSNMGYTSAAERAVKHADTLIAELNKEEPK